MHLTHGNHPISVRDAKKEKKNEGGRIFIL
jgi:hypothetical protein